MYEKFGKSFADIIAIKKSFFDDNSILLKKSLHYADLYIKQPKRKNCKICANQLNDKPDFIKQKVPYVICRTCGHLNGCHQDTDLFCAKLYTEGGGVEYARNYTTDDFDAYMKRRDAIYLPKAEFLLEALVTEGEDTDSLRFADMGAGAGYFVSALHDLGYPETKGYEVGQAQVDLGNFMLSKQCLDVIEIGQIIDLCASLEVDVISLIAVLEHVQDPRAVLQAIRANTSVRYFYFSVPMFSASVFNEMVFPNVFPRHLSMGHTHLFTRQSISHFSKEFGFTPVAAWWFGTDMMDYYRSVSVALEAGPCTSGIVEAWRDEFEAVLDACQLAIDRERRSSQVHMLMRFDG